MAHMLKPSGIEFGEELCSTELRQDNVLCGFGLGLSCDLEISKVANMKILCLSGIKYQNASCELTPELRRRADL